MSLGNKEVMARNIQFYLDKFGMTRFDLCDKLGFKYTTVSEWLNGNSYPRIDKIEMMARLFGVKKSDLVEEHNDEFGAYPIPLEKGASCGAGAAAYSSGEQVMCPNKIKADRAVYCSGDSMTGDDIRDGDLIYVKDTEETPSNGTICAAIIDGEAYIKHVFYDAGKSLTLASSNGSYAPMVYTGDDLEKVKVVGKVVGLFRAM